VHGAIHGDHFQCAGTDAEQPGEGARHKHQAESGLPAANLVSAGALRRGKTAVEAQTRRQGIVGLAGARRGVAARGRPGGMQEHRAENHAEDARGDFGGGKCAANRAYGGGDFQKHADADVGKALAHIRRRRA